MFSKLFGYTSCIHFQVTSVWLTVAFAADRYLMICHPFWAKRWCTIKLAKIVIIIIYVFSVIYSIPRYFEYQIFEVQLPMNAIDWNLHDNNNNNNNDNNAVQIDENLRNTNVVFVQNLSTSFNTTSSSSTAPPSHISPDMNITSLYGDFSYSMKTIPVIWYRLSEFGQSEQFRKVYHLWSWVLLVVGIPFVSIAIMNTFLILEVRKSSRKCVDQLKKREFRRQDTNIMLIGVIVIFFICQVLFGMYVPMNE
ncbi:unnamed protein product [Trichobilharzia regenti]|nr:unnamed protein product [Trichobilharzia regenti]